MLEYRLAIFWAAMALAIPVFIVGLWAHLSIWLRGRVYHRGREVTQGKLWAVMAIAARAIFSARFSQVVGALVLDGFLHRRLFHEDKGRWLAHACLMGGFVTMFALSMVTGFCEDILRRFFHVQHPLVLAITNKDNPAIALSNEILGLIIIVGLVLSAIRRYGQKPAQLRTTGVDTAIIALLALILLTSYPTESFRYLMEDTPPIPGWYGFIGYALALALKPLGLAPATWRVVHFWSFMAHIGVTIAFFVYIPFSKFLHVMVSPLVATINSLQATEAG